MTELWLEMASKYIVVDGVERRRDVEAAASAVTFLVSAAVYTELMPCSHSVSVEWSAHAGMPTVAMRSSEKTGCAALLYLTGTYHVKMTKYVLCV